LAVEVTFIRVMVIGVTGQIGAGKTSAARILWHLGAGVVDADLIGRQVVEKSAPLRKKLARAFGKEIVDSQGQIRRKKLASLAFANRKSRDLLNSLVHPYLLRELRAQVKSAAKTHAVVVIDAALLLHWGMDDEVDFVMVIHAGQEIRLSRLAKRGIGRRDGLARQKAQLPFRQFQRKADRIILNNSDPADLRRKIKFLWDRITSQTD
jgi:dephospho-CoA kinase